DDARRRQRAEWGLGDDGVVLTLFSPMGSGKLLDWVAQAWRALRHDARLRLLVIGPDRPDVRARLADAAPPRAIATRHVATDAAERRRAGAAAREFWAAHFTWPVIADRLLHHADVA